MNKINILASALILAALSQTPAVAGMTPARGLASPALQQVDCAVGFHLGPAGACIIGTPDPEPRVIEERRATDENCETRSVKRTDERGNSETRTRTNCD